jgi:hypothetical protein
MRVNYFFMCLPLAAALCVPSAWAAGPESTTAHSRFAGVYRSLPNDGGRQGPSMNVSLGRDGTATVTEDPGPGEKTLFGHWIDSGSQVKVLFDPNEDRQTPPAMVLQPSHDGLQAVIWDHNAWGNVEPPPMKKGFKVKTSYWLTTTR